MEIGRRKEKKREYGLDTEGLKWMINGGGGMRKRKC